MLMINMVNIFSGKYVFLFLFFQLNINNSYLKSEMLVLKNVIGNKGLQFYKKNSNKKCFQICMLFV